MKRDVLLGLLESIAESSCDEKSKERMQKQIEELKDDLKERSSVEQREKKLNEDLEEVMKNNNMTAESAANVQETMPAVSAELAKYSVKDFAVRYGHLEDGNAKA